MPRKKSFEARLKALEAMRDSIKRDFMAELEASSNLNVDGTPVAISKQRTCGLCGAYGHNARTCPKKRTKSQ